MVERFASKRSAMCDLIDLNSPDLKGLLDPTKLASPLIPAPQNVDPKNTIKTEKRESLGGNNPFDKVLNETADYISKKGDPFEVMSQRAMRFKSKRDADPKGHSPVGFTDDFTPKRKKRHLKKMNKTLDVLDESLLEDRLNLFGKERKASEEAHNSLGSSETNNICDSNVTESASVSNRDYKTFVNPFELSILNQSAMNDTLSDVVPKCKEDDSVFSVLEKIAGLKPLNSQRSLSQGAAESPVKVSCPVIRSKSVTSQNDINSVESSCLNRGFLESKQTECSVFSSLSNVSSITKWTSASLSSLPTDPMNHAFLDSSSVKMNQTTTNTPENSTEIKLTKYDLSDLVERLEKLKCLMNSTVSVSSTTEGNSMKDDNKRITDDKLIDVDVFVPAQNSSKESKASLSSSSIDSVFTDSSKVDKSIFSEAKALARTFEELALRSDSESMDDDLISSNNLWISELVPAFEEPVVDDLIELPVSPEKNSNTTSRDGNKTQLFVNDTDNSRDKFLKEIETDTQFTSPVVKQKIISSLLSDLKRLVNTESNSEVNKLLRDLENILNVNCENNTELLRAYLNASNDLQSPPKRLSDSSERLEKSDKHKSEENSEKVLSEQNNRGNETSQLDVKCKSENISQAVNDDGSVVKNMSIENNSKDNSNVINSPKAPETEVRYAKDVGLAVKLLENLEKLLSGQVEEATTMELLKNIGRILNVASGNNKTESRMRTDCNKIHDIRRTAPGKPSELHRTSCSTSVTKSAHRRSFEPKSKPTEKKRRSLSAIDTPAKTPTRTQMHKLKETSVTSKKRFSSDPGFIDRLASKKIVTPEAARNAKKEEESNIRKIKSVAISDVKNKFKKKSDVISKRGPMKAVHPVDSMQKKLASFGKQVAQSSQSVTPPETYKTTSDVKIISSTPNSVDNYCVSKKSMKSKPVASSTPDNQTSKAASNVQSTSSDKKRNFSCDISPVATYVNTSVNDERRESPKRLSKLPTPKKSATPKRLGTDTIPRHYTPSKSPYSMKNQYSPQRLNKSLPDCQRYSPLLRKKSAEKAQHSPLKESNGVKVKPYKLISKLKRHNEKENDYS